MRTEAQDKVERPDLYRLRDEIANSGVPVASANVIARELYELKQRVTRLETASITSPHLQNVERRGETPVLDCGTFKRTTNGIPSDPYPASRG